MYIPTPPKAKLGRVSARGSTIITFNEDVFIYPDLKNKKVPLLPKYESDGRILQAAGPFEMINLIEVQVEAGDSSDTSMLGYSYTADFTDSRTIEINVVWENAPFVSAE